MHDKTLEVAPVADLQAGFRASVASIAWTAASSATAIVLGISSRSVLLESFGGVGLFDMGGSIALAIHFRHALHHEEISDRRERIAHRIVAGGLMVVGLATLGGSAFKLASQGHTSDPLGGLIVSAASIAVLGYLGIAKRLIGRRIPSPGLIADGWLSLTGCGTALCAVVGLVLNRSLGWSWADPAAAGAVAVTAIALATVNVRQALR